MEHLKIIPCCIDIIVTENTWSSKKKKKYQFFFFKYIPTNQQKNKQTEKKELQPNRGWIPSAINGASREKRKNTLLPVVCNFIKKLPRFLKMTVFLHVLYTFIK